MIVVLKKHYPTQLSPQLRNTFNRSRNRPPRRSKNSRSRLHPLHHPLHPPHRTRPTKQRRTHQCPNGANPHWLGACFMIRLAAIVAQYAPELLKQSDHLLPSQLSALSAFQNCRSATSPKMQLVCEPCAHEIWLPHSAATGIARTAGRTSRNAGSTSSDRN